jgi:hypothetical protein
MTLKWDYKNRTCTCQDIVSAPHPKTPNAHTLETHHTHLWSHNSVRNKGRDGAIGCKTIAHTIAVDPTVLMPLNEIATEQTKATEMMQAATCQLLDYLVMHPDATTR